MRTLALPAGLALVGLVALGLLAGDPRATRDVLASWHITLAGLGLAVAVGAAAWWVGRRRSAWLLPPSVLLAVIGGLSGWIAGAEFTHQPDSAAHLATTPARVAFMLAMTAAGMALPSVLLAWLAGLTRRDRART